MNLNVITGCASVANSKRPRNGAPASGLNLLNRSQWRITRGTGIHHKFVFREHPERIHRNPSTTCFMLWMGHSTSLQGMMRLSVHLKQRRDWWIRTNANAETKTLFMELNYLLMSRPEGPSYSLLVVDFFSGSLFCWRLLSTTSALVLTPQIF